MKTIASLIEELLTFGSGSSEEFVVWLTESDVELAEAERVESTLAHALERHKVGE